ncbi:MAG: hypothetical protein ABJ308_13890 [Halieaceae bacterium]
MDIETTLQLEALKLLQDWSVWIITISTAFVGFIGFALKELNGERQLHSARYCIGFLMLTVVLAVILVGAIPAVIQKLGPEIADNPVILGANARGVYGYLYLDFIPLWLLVSGQRIAFLIGLFFGARLVWLKSGDYYPGS